MANSFEAAAIVLHPFGVYAKGDVIRDQNILAAILKGGNAASVIVTQIPVATAAQAGKEKV